LPFFKVGKELKERVDYPWYPSLRERTAKARSGQLAGLRAPFARDLRL